MILINLFGSPGAGKSTGAAYIFSQLKMRNINAELVTEFAKDKVWEKNDAALVNQAYMFGSQYYRISRIGDQVKVIITDSPLLLSLIYNKDPVLGESFNAMVKNVFSKFDSMNFFLKRVKKYNPVGRLQTEDESNDIAVKIQKLLDTTLVDYKIVDGSQAGYDSIVDAILDRINSESSSPTASKAGSGQLLTDAEIKELAHVLVSTANDYAAASKDHLVMNVATRSNLMDELTHNTMANGLYRGVPFTCISDSLGESDTIKFTMGDDYTFELKLNKTINKFVLMYYNRTKQMTTLT